MKTEKAKLSVIILETHERIDMRTLQNLQTSFHASNIGYKLMCDMKLWEYSVNLRETDNGIYIYIIDIEQIKVNIPQSQALRQMNLYAVKLREFVTFIKLFQSVENCGTLQDALYTYGHQKYLLQKFT